LIASLNVPSTFEARRVRALAFLRPAAYALAALQPAQYA